MCGQSNEGEAQQTANHGCRAADAEITGYGLERAILCACAAFKACVPVYNKRLFFLHCNYIPGANLCRRPQGAPLLEHRHDGIVLHFPVEGFGVDPQQFGRLTFVPVNMF